MCDVYEIEDNNFNYILLSYIANTHARTRARSHTPPSPFMSSLFDGSVAPNRDGVNAPFS